jgi:hypothetical protein
MTEKFIDEIIVVPGHPEDAHTCITSDTRPDPGHCWARAALACQYFKDFDYFVRCAAATDCLHMFEAIVKIPRPPQRAIEFGWGNFPHLGIDKRQKT